MLTQSNLVEREEVNIADRQRREKEIYDQNDIQVSYTSTTSERKRVREVTGFHDDDDDVIFV